MSHQKVCDIYDFFDPEVDDIMRNTLGTVPFGSRRTWEFAMIFRALRARGKLHRSSRGIGMGAGTERLIYALAKHAGHLLVTDLYLPNSQWVGVRTDDPKGLVMKRAPWPVNAKKLDVRAMDMRALDCPDDSFDFAWSTGAIEHIGRDEDFARHLSEVHRVLKPGGVYAFTTAVVFGPKTLDIPHNYYFHPEHLIDLLHASPLTPEPEFDCHVSEHLYNHPHPERFEYYGVPAAGSVTRPVVSLRRGALLAANLMTLTKEPAGPKQRPRVVGYGETTARLERERDRYTRQLWADFQQIALDGEQRRSQPQQFGAAAVELDLLCAGARPFTMPALTVISRAVDEFRDCWRTDACWRVRPGKANRYVLRPEADRLYTFVLRPEDWTPDASIVLRARHEARADTPATRDVGTLVRNYGKLRGRLARS